MDGKMRISVVTGGSRGDVQPAAILARELQRRGHEIRFWAQESFRDLTHGFGLEFHELSGAAPEKVWKELEANRPPTRIGRIRQLLSPAPPVTERLAEWEAACADVDAVVLTSATSLLRNVLEARPKPYVITYVSPFFPTGDFPSPGIPFWPRQGRFLNRLCHYAHRQFFWIADRPWVNRWRGERLGLRPLPLHAFHTIEREHPVLFGYSNHIIPTPSDWPDNCLTTGYWFSPDSIDPDPPPGLEEFLQEPCVAVGFGSSIAKDAGMDALVSESLRDLGLRGVIIKGWTPGEEYGRKGNLFYVRTISYEWLFARVKAVLHTGGSGVSSIAMAQGVPSVTIPFGGDQRFWAWRLYAQQAGTEPISFRDCDATLLKARIHEATTSAGMRSKCLWYRERIAAENGIKTACDAIEAAFTRKVS